MQEKNEKLVALADLCDHCAWPEKSLRFHVYLPIGLMLLIFRLAAISILYPISFITPNQLKPSLYRFQMKILGIQVNCNLSRDEIRNHTDGCVVAANHISRFDLLMSCGLPNATIMIGKPVKTLDLLNRLMITSAINLSQVKQWHVVDRRGLAQNIREWRKTQSGTTLYTTPEMTLGNQRGIFKMNSAFLCFDLPVVPMAARVENSLGMNFNPINSSDKAILLRLLMLPKIVFHLSYLEKRYRSGGESKEDFTKRVQQSIAEELGVPATEWTAADKHAYRKELSARTNQP